MDEEPYQPMLSLFLAPVEFRKLFPTIKALINSDSFLEGKFVLKPPKSEKEHRLGLYQMKILSKQQTSFVKSLTQADLIMNFQKENEKTKVFIKEQTKLRGRPKLEETLLSEIKSINTQFLKLEKKFSYRKFLKGINTKLAKKVCTLDTLELAILGKRAILDIDSPLPATQKIMKDVSVDNVQRMIDFGIGIPGALSLDGKLEDEAESLDFFTQDISIQADLLNLSIESDEVGEFGTGTKNTKN